MVTIPQVLPGVSYAQFSIQGSKPNLLPLPRVPETCIAEERQRASRCISIFSTKVKLTQEQGWKNAPTFRPASLSPTASSSPSSSPSLSPVPTRQYIPVAERIAYLPQLPFSSSLYVPAVSQTSRYTNITACEMNSIWQEKIKRLLDAWKNKTKELESDPKNYGAYFAHPVHQHLWLDYKEFLVVAKKNWNTRIFIATFLDPRNIPEHIFCETYNVQPIIYTQCSTV